MNIRFAAIRAFNAHLAGCERCTWDGTSGKPIHNPDGSLTLPVVQFRACPEGHALYERCKEVQRQ